MKLKGILLECLRPSASVTTPLAPRRDSCTDGDAHRHVVLHPRAVSSAAPLTTLTQTALKSLLEVQRGAFFCHGI